MIEKIISGGQIGADIAALRAAKSLGIKTGGWMPKDYRTLVGLKPEYAEEFDMQENQSSKYSDRTFLNVRDADATVRFALNFDSPGERCTMKAIRAYGKLYYDIPLFAGIVTVWDTNIMPAKLAIDLSDDDVKILNVAGNADKNIEPFVFMYLQNVIQIQRTGVY